MIEWKVEEGGCVEKDSVILLVETAKMVNDIEAEASGFLHILIEEGIEAPIGSVAGLIAESKEELDALQKDVPHELSAAAESEDAPEVEAESPARVRDRGERIHISPAQTKISVNEMIMKAVASAKYLINSVLPIINPPECDILGVGRIERRAVPVKNDILIRDIMTLTLAADHRAVDGVYGSGSLKTIQRYLEKFPS